MDIHKICRVCLEEGALTSIYSTEFAMMPCVMMMFCSKIRVYKSDGLPAVICNKCIYRLGVAYHFKQECENSDIRLRQYLGLPCFGLCDAETNTEVPLNRLSEKPHTFLQHDEEDDSDEDELINVLPKKSKRRSRYTRKPPQEHKKRGPKPLPKLPHTCYECNKTFKCQAQLQTHIRTHTGEKPFECRYCPRRFAQKYNLQIHERTHSGERPFQCEICSKQFAALGNFQAHQKIHTGIRDQICPVCQKGFYTAGDLTKHVATHTGLKNHHCDVCGKSFSRHRDMQSHKRKLHAISEPIVDEDDDEDEAVDATDTIVVGNDVVQDSFKCPDCDKEFATPGGLSMHYHTHANNNILSLQLSGGSNQMPLHAHSQPHALVTHGHPHGLAPPLPPPPPPPPHHYHHPVATAAPTAMHPHEGLHAHHHHHHLSMATAGPPPTMQSAGATSAMMHMHMLAPPPPPPPPTAPIAQSALGMSHPGHQRLHPY